MGNAVARLALDTGAVETMVNENLLISIGYNTASGEPARIVTGSRVENVARVSIDTLAVLGQQRSNFPVIAHTLPPSSGVDGLLGLNFLRGQVLVVDFVLGEVMLTQPQGAL